MYLLPADRKGCNLGDCVATTFHVHETHRYVVATLAVARRIHRPRNLGRKCSIQSQNALQCRGPISRSAEGNSPLPRARGCPRTFFFSFSPPKKAGVQRAAALCRGRGGVPRTFFFLFFAAAGGKLRVDLRCEWMNKSTRECKGMMERSSRSLRSAFQFIAQYAEGYANRSSW